MITSVNSWALGFRLTLAITRHLGERALVLRGIATGLCFIVFIFEEVIFFLTFLFSRLHVIVLSGTASDPPITLSCNTTCDVTFTFPIETELVGLGAHMSGFDLLTFGNQVWYSSLNAPIFYKLADMATGELATTIATAAQHTAYAVLTNKGAVYYGRTAVHDSVVVPSTLSYLQGPAVSNIHFDAEGHLFSIYLDTPTNLPSATFPIGLYENNAGDLRNFTDPTVLHKSQLLVSGTISSSDYAYSSCPLALLIEDETVVFRQMQSGCSFDSKIANRVLDMTSGGSVTLQSVINGTLVVGTITDPILALILPSSLANASLALYASNDGSCTVSVVSSYAGFASTDANRTITYRLDSVYLSAFVDSTHMNGLSLSCLTGFDTELAQATNSSRRVILTGAGIFTYADGPTPDGLGWLVPGGQWNMYDISSPTQYRITAQCLYDSLTFSNTSYLVR